MGRSVHPGGLAANSKRIRPGDILVSLNDQPVEGKTLVEVHNVIQVCNISPALASQVEPGHERKLIPQLAGIYRANIKVGSFKYFRKN